MPPIRQTGTLLPLSSLPGAAFCGDLGPAARNFVDHLAAHQVTTWQLLPLHPTEDSFGNSPYSAQSVFAGDERYVSIDDLVAEAWLSADYPVPRPDLGTIHSTDYTEAFLSRSTAVDEAWTNCSAVRRATFEDWRARSKWAEAYARWRAIADHQGTIHWVDWPAELKDANGPGVARFAEAYEVQIERIAFGQFVYAVQWQALHTYAESQSVRLLGDVPIYPHLDSADVWASSKFFKLADDGEPLQVAGVPPDYFSETGQLWGNPVYDWENLEEEEFSWWVERLRYAFQQFDSVRIDHFIGLVRAYEIPASHTDAKGGSYVDVPIEALFQTLSRKLPAMPIVAEDLGVPLASVALFMQRWELPGMKVLQFAFGGEASNPYLPHNIGPDTVAYTGTHDNNTALGWWRDDTSAAERAHLKEYLGLTELTDDEVPEALLRVTLGSAAGLAIVPVQDVLGLGGEARINTPGTTSGNWTWRIDAETLYRPKPWMTLARLATLFGRAKQG